MKNIKNKTDIALYIITPLLILNLVLDYIDKLPILSFINALALVCIGVYALTLSSK